ncbi:rim15, signal transduction response regulator [Neophaeococcomyces mojaviensis]|uniref:Rim15, signal transduction response regulator n=1 Tax=Neophaeococcomyces mojaviensis TaxID=3383035 RepID=A0ACC3AFG3_9EURO|nr:rim15, signal transduction response regulator [Knufia sp. JES_112]
MAQDGSNRQIAQSPTVAALKYDAGVGPEPHKVMMERSFSQDIQEGTQELKEAAEQTRNIILDLSLDGIIRWVSPSWTDVVGTNLEAVKGKPIAHYIKDDKTAFERAIAALKSNDKSQFIKFTIETTPTSDLGPMLDVQAPSAIRTEDGQYWEAKVPLELEGQGIMVWDRATGGESHTMWMLQPAAEPIHIEVELPRILVDMLGVGAELLANYLSELTDAGANDPANHPPPLPIVCRICERSIVPWWFERHSDLCVQEHKAEMDVQMVQESLTEHRHAIVKVLDAFDTRSSRSGSGENTPSLPIPEYKGLPIGPSPSSSSLSSASGSQTASPARSRSPSTTGLGHGHARGRSSFIVRRPLVRIVELILDLCDTAIEINVPAIRDAKTDDSDEFRTQSPVSESRISQVLHWQPPSSLDTEPGLAALSADTERLARAKVEAVHRHQVILEYGERIRQEYLAEVDACISEALLKAERAAAGELSSSCESESDGEEPMVDIPLVPPTPVDEPTPQASLPEEPEMVRNQSRPQLRSMASALRNSLEGPFNFTDSRRPSSQAVSTGSSSPQECPTPKSGRSNLIAQPQPIHKRRSMYAAPEEAEGSDSSLPSMSSAAQARRIESPAPMSDQPLSRPVSSRDRKRRSMHLHGLSSASPHRGSSPGRYPPPPSSPLRMTKARLPSVDVSAQSPIVSPLLTSGEFPSPHYHHPHHRRQSSIHSDARAPLSPRLSTTAHPQPRAQPPSIKDFEIVKPISKGAFGSVYLSKKKLTGEYFAIKVLRKADMVAKNQVTNVKAERAIMMWQGESDFVAKLYWTFSSKDYLFLVMEYLNGGDCASLVKILGGLTEDWAKKYVAEVVLGVEHLHSRGIVHRDLKPDNLLIDSKGHLKLTDFGLSRMGLIGRQKRALKSPNEPDPDLFKQGHFSSQISGPTSRSASFDYHQGPSPGQTPLMTPALAGGLDQPSYFNLNRESSLSREFSRRASGYRSDSGSVSSYDLHHAFQGLGLSDGNDSSRPVSIYQKHNQIEEESFSQASASPDLMPLSQSMSNLSVSHPNMSLQMLPPPTALFDPDESGKRFVGTPDYLAPETITGTVQDEMCDWWSLGCILFEFLYGVPPFNAPTTEQVFDNILNRRIAWPDDNGEFDVSDDAKDLINKLIQLDPRQRLGANPQDKFPSGGAEIQAHPWFSDINWETLLEDEAQFVPNPENPEDTEYFDTRGATLQAFPEEMEDQISPGLGGAGGDYLDRPHDALMFKARAQVASGKRGLIPLHIPPHIAGDSRNRRLSEPMIADDFGNFTFKNLPVLEKANKDIVEKMRKETLQAQARSAQSIQMTSQPVSLAPTPIMASPSPSVEGSPMVPMPVQRALSVNKHHRPASPSGLGSSTASPIRGSQPSSPMHIQFSAGQHERRKTSGSSNSSSLQNSTVYDPSAARMPAVSSPIKRMSTISPAKSAGSLQPGSAGRSRSHTVGSQDSESQLREPFIPGHHKRKSQLFVRDQSPSSSDNENTAHTKALLKVQRKRQSSRRMSQISFLEGPAYRPLDILICEDHPVSKMVMEKLCEKLRCRTITATSGPQAIGYAGGQIQFDIIFTEYKLPLINGVDLARMIRDTKSANTHTPIVCITGYLKDLPADHQFDSLLQKPPTTEKLTEALCKYCSWKPPPKDFKPHMYMPTSTLPGFSANQRVHDSPSSVASSRVPTLPESSYKGSSREDSISSGGFFSDLESLKADDIPVIISRTTTDEWSHGGLGISEDSVLDQDALKQAGFPALTHAESAPPTTMTDDRAAFPPLLRQQPSFEAIRSKRESIEKLRTNTGGAEEGDDEDEELGRIQFRQKSPISKTTRASSKLGHEMLRTNSRGSVISMHDERLAEESNLRRSLELLEERMGGLRIPEEEMALLGSVQPRKGARTASEHSHPEPERPGSRGHITPPIFFPLVPGHMSKEFDMDDQATPLPSKVIDFEEQPTPRARSENGSASQQQQF